MTELDLTPLFLSLKLGLVTTLILVLIGTPLAWIFATRQGRIARAFETLIALPLVLPPTVIGFYLLLVLGPEGPIGRLAVQVSGEPLTFRFSGLVIGSIVYSLPFVIQPLVVAFERVDRRLIDAAATLGSGPFDRFIHVVLPMARSGYLKASVLAFAHTLGEFGVILMIGGSIPGETRVVSIAIYDHVEALQYEQAHLYSLILVAISFVALLIINAGPRRGERAWP